MAGAARDAELATNWDQPQTVIVHGVDDALQDGNVAYTLITAPAVSADFDYAGLDADDVSATHLDLRTLFQVNVEEGRAPVGHGRPAARFTRT